MAEHVAHRAEEYADLVGGFVVSDVKVADLAKRACRTWPPEPTLAREPGRHRGRRRDRAGRHLGQPLRGLWRCARSSSRCATRRTSPTTPSGSSRSSTPLGEPARRRHRLRGAADPARTCRRTAGSPRSTSSPLARSTLKFRTGGVTADLFPDLARSWPPASRRRWTASCRSSARPACTTPCGTATRQTGFEHHGFLNVLLATRTCLDGGSPDEVAQVLDETDGAALAARILGDPDVAARTRRWFTSFGSCSVLEAHEDLVELGLVDCMSWVTVLRARRTTWTTCRTACSPVGRRPAAGRRTAR